MRVLSATEVLAQQATKAMALKDVLQASDRIAEAVMAGLRTRAEITSLGLDILGVSIRAVKPSPETAKALEAEAREAILKNADEAIFARRNFAVEQERAIRESELDTEIAVEQKKRSIRETQMDAEASVARKKNEQREADMITEITLENKRQDFVQLNAANTRTLADADAYRVGALMKIFEGVDTRVIQALAAAGMQPSQLIAQAFTGIAEKAEKIGELNMSPELLRSLLDRPRGQEAARGR
jgi:regulator of protease activity HflC (stomatin/prohibitin superfamily)